jgi:hypothetical protein
MRRLIPVFCLLFGAMTLREGAGVLFIDGPERQAAGNFVPWVLWFNFTTGFALVATGIGMWTGRGWAARLASITAALSGLVLLAFLVRVASGGGYENRTLVAMPLRTAIWVGLAFWSARAQQKEKR